MKIFKDTEGRDWTVSVNVAAIKRVRDLLEINLYAIADDGFALFGRLIGDPILLADVLYCLVKDQADKRGLSDEDFGRSLAGGVIADAQSALIDEIIDFFPDPRVRGALAKAKAMNSRVSQKLAERAELELEALDIDSMVDRLIASSTNSQGSSESTPTPSRSESSP